MTARADAAEAAHREAAVQPGLEPEDAALVARLVPPVPSPYHRLNPLTKAAIATAGSLAAIVVGGYPVPLLVIVAALVSAEIAGLLGRLVRVTVAVGLALAISIVLVSTLTRAGETVLFVIGPFDVTAEGVDFAAQTLLKVFALSLSIGLFTLTTHPRALVADLERRGVSSRFAFVALATIEAVPAMVRRAGVIAEAQRARGLDSEGGVVARARGLLPLVGPVLISAVTEVEQRSLALEARAFSRPGRRDLLWAMPDRGAERALRWIVGGVLLAVVLGHLGGLV
ncbi:MAG TPA: energy-coupling factor transporter transmembrane component T [Candidatus Limnocylindrales bacterium]|nr:energy-coupling factor transporter transmembrane component T [Candidatus Limnocylindrales bacterium]